MLGYLRHNSVGGDDVLNLLGPGVHEAEPSAPQRDEGAVFDFEFVTVGVDLLSHLQHCGQTRNTIRTNKNICIIQSHELILSIPQQAPCLWHSARWPMSSWWKYS